MRSEVTVPLSEPILAHGEEVRELTLRPPTGKDLRLCGLPYRVTQSEEIVMDAGVLASLVVQLAGVPLSSVDKLSARDFQEVTSAVMGFFRPAKPDGTVTPSSS